MSPGTLELWLLPAGFPRQLPASFRGRRASGAALASERAGGALQGAAAGRAACGGAEPQPQALQVRAARDPNYAHSKLSSARLVCHAAVALQCTGCAAASSTSRVWRPGRYMSHLVYGAAVLLLVLQADLPAVTGRPTCCYWARRLFNICRALGATLTAWTQAAGACIHPLFIDGDDLL